MFGSGSSSSSSWSSTSTSSGNSSGNSLSPKPFGLATNIASPFGTSNSSGTTSGVVGATVSPFPSTKTVDASSATDFWGSNTDFGFTSPLAPGFPSSSFGDMRQKPKPAFGASRTTGVGFSSSTTFGGSNSLGTTKSLFGSQVPTPTFGSQNRGSRVATYKITEAVDPTTNQPIKLESISAMPVYRGKSHEELRSEDYQFGDKGGFVWHDSKTKSIAFNASSASVTPSNTSTSNPFRNFSTHLSASTSVLQPTLVSGPNGLSLCSYPSSSGFATPLLNGSSNSPIYGIPSSSRIPLDLPSSLFTLSVDARTPRNPFSSIAPPTASGFSFFSSSSFTNSLTTSSCTPSTSVTLPAPPFGPISSFSLFQPSNSPALSVNPVSSATSPSPPIGGSFFASSPSTTSVYAPSTTITVSEPFLFASSPSISTSISPSGISPYLYCTNNQPSLWSPRAHSPQNNIGSVAVTEAGGQNNMAKGFDSQTTAAWQLPLGVNPFGSLPPIPKMSTDGSGSFATSGRCGFFLWYDPSQRAVERNKCLSFCLVLSCIFNLLFILLIIGWD